MDADMSAELTDHLFQQDGEKFGLDLVFITSTELYKPPTIHLKFPMLRLVSTSKEAGIMA